MKRPLEGTPELDTENARPYYDKYGPRTMLYIKQLIDQEITNDAKKHHIKELLQKETLFLIKVLCLIFFFSIL